MELDQFPLVAATQPILGGGKARSHRQGHHPAGAEVEDTMFVDPGVTVAADTAGDHIDRFDMGLPIADFAAVGGQDRSTAPDQGNIGGGAADINHQAVGLAVEGAEVGGAGRAAGHGQAGVVDGGPGADRLTVATDDIYRAVKIQSGHGR